MLYLPDERQLSEFGPDGHLRSRGKTAILDIVVAKRIEVLALDGV
jgi:hypothetical protein